MRVYWVITSFDSAMDERSCRCATLRSHGWRPMTGAAFFISVFVVRAIAYSDCVCGVVSTMIGCDFRVSGLPLSALGSIRSPTRARSSNLPKIIYPQVVCNTEVTAMSTFLPISLRALSTTTMVPSSR